MFDENLGIAHGLEALVAAASKLETSIPDAQFLLIGEGAEKDKLKALAAARNLRNIHFLDQQPREKIPALISACDVCLVTLKKTDVFKTVIPTKMLEFMSCSRPVILGVDGQAREILEKAGAGIPIEPENSDALIAAIQQLYANRNLAESMGQNGREYIAKNFSRADSAHKYIHVIESLLGKS